MEYREGVIRYGPEDLKNIPDRKADANKGDYGRVLLIAGSFGMSGAAYLSALAAYRTGAGLVRILTPEDNRIILQTSLPEAIVTAYDPEEILSGNEKWKQKISGLLEWPDVIVLGPGLGKEGYAVKLTEEVLSSAYVPLLIDADGLNTIAAYPYLTNYYTENIIVTPHVGEMARLTGKSIPEVCSDLLNAASEYRDTYGVTCLLKSDRSVTASNDGKLYETVYGTPALAKAGTGDVLTGVIAGLLCLGYELGEAAAFGSFLHAMAGRKAAEKFSEHGILSRDVADAIPLVMKKRTETEEKT